MGLAKRTRRHWERSADYESANYHIIRGAHTLDPLCAIVLESRIDEWLFAFPVLVLTWALTSGEGVKLDIWSGR
jgi:hypothetical protein